MMSKRIASMIMVLTVLTAFALDNTTTVFAGSSFSKKISTSSISVVAYVGQTGISSTTLSFSMYDISSNAKVSKIVVNTGTLEAKGTFTDMKVTVGSNNVSSQTVSFSGGGNTDVTITGGFVGAEAQGTYTLAMSGKCLSGYMSNGYGAVTYKNPSVTVYYTY